MIFKSLKKLFKKVITKSVFAFGIWHTLQLKLANLGFLHSPLRSSLALQFKINFVPSSFHSTSTIKIRLKFRKQLICWCHWAVTFARSFVRYRLASIRWATTKCGFQCSTRHYCVDTEFIVLTASWNISYFSGYWFKFGIQGRPIMQWAVCWDLSNLQNSTRCFKDECDVHNYMKKYVPSLEISDYSNCFV
jgi:hypothetical protein